MVDSNAYNCLPWVESRGDMTTRVSPKNIINDRQPLLFLRRYMLTGKVDALLVLTLHAIHVRLRDVALELRPKSIASCDDTMQRAIWAYSEVSEWMNDAHEQKQTG